MVNKSTNTFENGLIRVDNKTKQPKNSYSFALNTVINDPIIDPSSRANEKGFDVYIRLKESPYNIIGRLWLGNNEYVIWIKHIEGSTAFNEIWYTKESTKTLIYSNTALNLSDIQEISATYRIDFRGHRLIYWVDGLNEDRVIDIDDPNVSLLNINSLSFLASYTKPDIDIVAKNTGGSLITGQYFIAVSYNLEDLVETAYLAISKPVSIGVGSLEDEGTILSVSSYPDVSGAIDTPTTKSILVSLDNIPDVITTVNILVIRKTDSGYSIRTIRDIDTSIVSEYKVTGNQGEESSDIDISDITTDLPIYYASNAIIQKENRLIRANSRIKENQINYQSIANNIQVRYKITEDLILDSIRELGAVEFDSILPNTVIPVESSISPDYLSNTGSILIDSKTFMRDEVYSLGVGFELTDGSETEVFHIPGRINDDLGADAVGNSGEFGYTYTNSAQLWDTFVYITASPGYNIGDVTWQVRNTAVKLDSTTGILGYYRTETAYPDGYGFPTNGEKNSSEKSYIRHHRMPSDILEPLYRTEVYNVEGGDNTLITTSNQSTEFNIPDNDYRYKIYKRYLSLDLSNIIIPSEYQSVIKKVKIYYTPRTEENKTVLAKGILYGQTQPAFNNVISTFNDHRAYFNVGEFVSPETKFSFKNYNIGGNKFKMYSAQKGYIKTVIFLGGRNYLYNTDLNNTTGRQQGIFIESCFYNLIDTIKESDRYKSINKAFYVDRNFSGLTEGVDIDYFETQDTCFVATNDLITSTGDLETSDYPELFYGSNTVSSVGYDELDTTPATSTIAESNIFYDSVFYGSIYRDGIDVNSNILNLDYVYTGNYVVIESDFDIDINVNGGDCFIDIHNFYMTLMRLKETGADTRTYNQNTNSTVPVNEVKALGFGAYFVETDINIRMRNSADEAGNYFPKSFIGDLSVNQWQEISNTHEYNNVADFYNTNYLKLYFSNKKKLADFTSDNINEYITRLIYSEKQDLESTTDNYRIVKANNYKDLIANRGPITGMFIKQENLFVLTRDSLFNVYTSNQTIKTDSDTDITVGTGEFFGIEPKELISIDGGFGGTSSKWSICETPYGYLYVDILKNKCLLFNDQIKDLNVLGLNENFSLTIQKEFPELFETFDDPIKNLGIISIYDPKLLRILITKKDYSLLDPSKNKGEFNELTTYTKGDVYSKNGLLKIADNITVLDTSDFSNWSTSIFTNEFNNVFG